MCEAAFGLSLGLGLALGWSAGFIGAGWLWIIWEDRRERR